MGPSGNKSDLFVTGKLTSDTADEHMQVVKLIAACMFSTLPLLSLLLIVSCSVKEMDGSELTTLVRATDQGPINRSISAPSSTSRCRLFSWLALHIRHLGGSCFEHVDAHVSRLGTVAVGVLWH